MCIDSVIPLICKQESPAYAFRGAYLDISRGQVPTINTLEKRITQLAALGYNHVQLYVEHVFPFSFLGSDSDPANRIEPSELRFLDNHCRTLGIDFVPSLAVFGHMGMILSLERFAHLREACTESDSPSLRSMGNRWRQLMSHHTLAVQLQESRELVAGMLAQYLPNFSSPWVNVCCDETFDLGLSSLGPDASNDEKQQLFLSHVLFLHQLVTEMYGKRMMIWGDMLVHYPEIITHIPSDVLILNWQYAPDASASQSRFFDKAGRTFINCPGVQGWNRFSCDYPGAYRNILAMARHGLSHGATGLLVTDWGDWGHPNQWVSSLPLFAFAAVVAWDGPDRFADEQSCRQWMDELPGLLPGWFCAEALAVFQALPTSLNRWALFNHSFASLMHLESDPYGPMVRDQRILEQACMDLEVLAARASALHGVADDETALGVCAAVQGVLMQTVRSLAAVLAVRNQSVPSSLLLRYEHACTAYIDALRPLWALVNKPSRLVDIEGSVQDSLSEMVHRIRERQG